MNDASRSDLSQQPALTLYALGFAGLGILGLVYGDFTMQWQPVAPWIPLRTALAYGAWAADTLLPNVITFTPGTVANWDPWFDASNGKGVIEDIASNMMRMIVNQDFSSGLEPGRLLDYFPYLAPPPPTRPKTSVLERSPTAGRLRSGCGGRRRSWNAVCLALAPRRGVRNRPFVVESSR